MNSNVARTILAGALCLMSAAVVSCRAGGSTSASDANDRLRRQVMDLEEKLKVSEGRNQELLVKLEAAGRARESVLPKDVLDAMPRCVGVAIGSLSGYQPARGDHPALIVVDVEPTDAYGRFVQVVGTLAVEARVLAPVGDQGAPERVYSATLAPAQLREAYRAGLMGAHYTVELAAPGWPGAGDLVLRVRFTDALTGQEHVAERTRPGRGPGAEPGR